MSDLKIHACKTPRWGNRPRRDQYAATVEVYDALRAAGFHPADMGLLTVTFRPGDFAKLIAATTNGICSVNESANWRVSAVWAGEVEICCTEETGEGGWVICENWKPI